MTAQSIGNLLREWRQRRRMSQLDLAFEADVSAKHLSFIETGRARPSREMILHLAEQLEIPLRDRNPLLAAAGFAPAFAERTLADPILESARNAIDLILAGHEPYPALAIDHHWTIVAANRAVAPLFAGVDAALMEPPVNILRLSLHPGGLAPRIINLTQCRSRVLSRLRHQVQATADTVLSELLDELCRYPGSSNNPANEEDYNDVIVPLQITTDFGILSLFSTTTVFGTPRDITLSEIAIESFFPADAASADILRHLSGVS
jgi:transcriptional regulator with XRE-family HTH domain